MMTYVKIQSEKHPGAVFVKERGTKDNFICKVYPGHEAEANAILALPEIIMAARSAVELAGTPESIEALKEALRAGKVIPC